MGNEIGPQRRKQGDRLLHACCICHRLDIWGEGWWHSSSERELDENLPIAKFCSQACREKAGPDAERVTRQMKAAARELEYRPPKPYVAPPPGPRTYADAAQEQRRARERAERLAAARRERENGDAV